MTISCLGYVTWSREVQIQKDVLNFSVALSPDNLALEGASVTAKEDGNAATTSRTIDRTALEHVQMMNVADVSSLLPGGATVDPSLTSEKQFNIRAASGESGNASFGADSGGLHRARFRALRKYDSLFIGLGGFG